MPITAYEAWKDGKAIVDSADAAHFRKRFEEEIREKIHQENMNAPTSSKPDYIADALNDFGSEWDGKESTIRTWNEFQKWGTVFLKVEFEKLEEEYKLWIQGYGIELSLPKAEGFRQRWRRELENDCRGFEGYSIRSEVASGKNPDFCSETDTE